MKNILFIIFLISFSGFSKPKEGLQETIIDKIAASVNSDVILLSDVEYFKKNYADYYFSRATGTPLENILRSDKAILDVLIDNVLIDQTIVEMNLKVSDIMLEKRIEGILKENHIDKDRLKIMVTQNGKTYEEWRENYRREMERHMLIDQEIKPRVAINDFDLKNYYNTKIASTPQEEEFELIDFVAKGTKSGLLNLRKLLNEGAALEKVKEKCIKECVAIDLGFMKQEALLPEMSGALKELKKGGKITQVIEINGMYHLVFIKSMRLLGTPEFEKIKENLSSQYFQIVLEQEISNWLNERKKLAFIEIK